MAMPSPKQVAEDARSGSFDVTCVIGTVIPSEDGTLSSHEAAFVLIAKHDTPGTFSWSNDGHEVVVTVEYPQSS